MKVPDRVDGVEGQDWAAAMHTDLTFRWNT